MSERLYKIRLASGRTLGPIEISRIELLVYKDKIIGTESARVYPRGDWKDINLIPEIADIFLSKATGKLEEKIRQSKEATELLKEAEVAIPISDGTLTFISETKVLPENQTQEPEIPTKTQTKTKKKENTSSEKSVTETVFDFGAEEDTTLTNVEIAQQEYSGHRALSEERTIVFQNKKTFGISLPKKGGARANKGIVYLLFLGVCFLFFQDLLKKEPKKIEPLKPRMLRAVLPKQQSGASQPLESNKKYALALPRYLEDTVNGYRSAADILLVSIELDSENIKATALLASCYLNLIDSSNKDENYFNVITSLIDSAGARAIDLQELVIADVEFFITVNRAEAAQNRIVEYTKTHKNFDLILFYYIAYAFYSRGNFEQAATYISKIPDNHVFSAKVFYLRGLIAEKYGDTDSAFLEYQNAIRFNKNHARSYLRLADLLVQQGKIKEAKAPLDFVVTHGNLLNPKELARGYYLHAMLAETDKKWNFALGDIENAVRLERDNSDYLLEMYSLRARLGESIKFVQKEARMYYFLGEGQKLLRQGNYHEALTFFLQARESNLDSALPLIKTGDMFAQLNDISNARLNYELAAKRAPNNIEVWSKYIRTLIQSYDWEEAKKALDRFRLLPVSQSAIDKAAGDMYAKQGRFEEAQTFYKKAMARDTIDPDVYTAFANSLVAVKKYKEAPFFFSLALRYDPLNVEAVIGTAKSIAASESIDRAIQMLRDELQKGGVTRAEFLAAIAEFQIQRGEWELAQKHIDQAIEANPDYAYPWKLQAQIFLNREGKDKNALDKALAAYKSYSDRNASDPIGYLERYRVFIKKSQFEQAGVELDKIYSIFPKYPNLHFYKGALYVIQGNHKAAAEEFKKELSLSPNNVNAMIALGKENIETGLAGEALNLFSRAMQFAPNATEPKHMAAYANYLLKNYQSAVALYRAALSLDPGNPILYKRLGLVYWDMGDPTSARTSFRKYLEMEPDAPDRGEFEKFL